MRLQSPESRSSDHTCLSSGSRKTCSCQHLARQHISAACGLQQTILTTGVQVAVLQRGHTQCRVCCDAWTVMLAGRRLREWWQPGARAMPRAVRHDTRTP